MYFTERTVRGPKWYEREVKRAEALYRLGGGPGGPEPEKVAASLSELGYDDYKSRLLKYIPAEVVAVYLTLDSFVRSSAEATTVWLYWAIFLFGLLAVPAYLRRVSRVHSTLQLTISTLAFLVWVFALGGPFEWLSWYRSLYGGLLLIGYTFLVPIIDPA